MPLPVSIAITGRARAVHLCALDPDDAAGNRRVFAPLKISTAAKPPPLAYEITGPPGAPFIKWLGVDPHSADELLGATLGADERAERDEVVWWLREYLKSCEGGQAPASEVYRAAAARGIALRTIQRARTRAGVSFKRSGWEAGSVWQLEDFEPPIAPHSRHPRQPQEAGADGADVAAMQMPEGSRE